MGGPTIPAKRGRGAGGTKSENRSKSSIRYSISRFFGSLNTNFILVFMGSLPFRSRRVGEVRKLIEIFNIVLDF